MAAKADQSTNPPNALQLQSDPRALQFKSILDSPRFQSSLKAALPRHLSAERMIRLVLGSFQQNPSILECTPESVLLSVMQAASMGLEVGAGVIAEAYLVPFWNNKKSRRECQCIAGFKGLIKLARQSGEVADVWAEVVYEADTRQPGSFEYELGLNPTLKHKRNDDAAERGELRYAYAVARFRDGERKFVVMNKAEVTAIKNRTQSKTKDGKIVGPWADHEAEMWKKTAVRRLAKMLPLSVETRIRVDTDEAVEDGREPEKLDLGDVSFALPAPESTDTQAADATQNGPSALDRYDFQLSDAGDEDAIHAITTAAKDDAELSADDKDEVMGIAARRLKAIKTGGQQQGSLV